MNVRHKVRQVIAREESVTPDLPEDTSSMKRAIPAKHDFDPRALKPLARALFSSSVSLGHAVTAYKEFTRIKSSSISPDGMIGGRGYILQVRDLRAKLQQACELLSSVTDTIYDEIHAPHWAPKLGELGANDAEDITEFIDEAGQVLDDPEGYGEKELDALESKNDGEGGTSNETKWKDTPEGSSSEMPTGGDKEVENEAQPYLTQKTASEEVESNSSLPVTTLPGPRVDHLDRGEQTGPGGSYNKDEPPVEDAWGMLTAKTKGAGFVWGEASLPDADLEPTPTDARDFGIGPGANGDALFGPDRGLKSPGPSSDVPSDPGAPTRDPDGNVPPGLSGPDRNLWACEGGTCTCSGSCSCGHARLPTDVQSPAARADYFEGPKGGNQFDVRVHSDPLAESAIPGDNTTGLYNYDQDKPDVGQSVERHGDPYVKLDWHTTNYRNDMEDVFNYESSDRTDTNG